MNHWWKLFKLWNIQTHWKTIYHLQPYSHSYFGGPHLAVVRIGFWVVLWTTHYFNRQPSCWFHFGWAVLSVSVVMWIRCRTWLRFFLMWIRCRTQLRFFLMWIDDGEHALRCDLGPESPTGYGLEQALVEPITTYRTVVCITSRFF